MLLKPLRVQVQRRFGVLGDRRAGDAADRHQVGPAQHGGGTAEERGVPAVQALLDDAVEHLVLARHRVEGSQIVLDRVGIDEEVRGLHQEEVRVLQEMPDGALQDVLGRHVVGVQDQDQVARGMGQRRVDVAGLGGDVAFAGQVVDAQARRTGPEGSRGAQALPRPCGDRRRCASGRCRRRPAGIWPACAPDSRSGSRRSG